MSHPIAYTPSYRVLWWPADDATGAGTALVIGSGDVEVSDEEIAEFSWEIPVEVTDLPDDWEAFATEYLQRGTWLAVEVSEDNFVSGSYDKRIFYGTIAEVGLRRDDQGARISVTAYDPMMSIRGNGVNLSMSTRMLIYDDTWEYNGAEWDVSDPNFLVNLPDNLEEWVPNAMISLVAYKTAGSDIEPYEYERGEYAYSSGNKQIYFKNSQSDFKTEERRWRFRLYYFDATDTDTTVKKLLEQIFTGAPQLQDGGLGFLSGDLDFKPIMGWDAYGLTSDAYGYWYAYGTEKRVGIVVREKLDGPVTQLLDEMRDAGLLPRNYRIFYDPVSKKVRGRYMEQDAAAAVEPYFTAIADEQSLTAEQMAGRCEVYAESTTLEDYAPGATITVETPTFDNDGGSYDGDSYTAIGTTANLVDGKPDTLYQHWILLASFHGTKTQKTPENYLVFDLLETKSVKRIQLTTGWPQNAAGQKWSSIKLPFWLPKVTISGSNDMITAANPGIPVSANAICVPIDPLNAGANGGLDIDVECDWITQMRYVAIRFEQDFYARVSDGTGTIYRASHYGLSSVKILGDGHTRYLTGPDKGLVPFAQITNVGGTFTGVNAGAQQVTVSLTDVNYFSPGDFIAMYDTTGGQPFGTGGAIWTASLTNVDYGTGVIDIDTAFPTELVDGTAASVAIGDQMGWYRRWMLDLTGYWVDFFYPKLWRKWWNTHRWIELLPTEEAGDASEAEGLAVERLRELIYIQRDHQYLCTLDVGLEIGKTTKVNGETEDWLIKRITYHLNPQGGEAEVQMTIEGTNYEGAPE